MFASHKPRVYRSTCGCCICGSKSSSSRFTSSEKYEADFPACFEVKERTGVICNACVLLVKRWQKLPEGNKRSWGHVVDGKCTKRKNSRRSSSSTTSKEDANCDIMSQNTTCDVAITIDETSVKQDDNPTGSQGPSSQNVGTPPPYSPTPSDISSDCADDGRISTGCQTSFLFPQFERSEIKFPYIDLSGWRREEVCCGTIFKGPNGEVLVDPKLLKPYCDCSRRPNRTVVKQEPEER